MQKIRCGICVIISLIFCVFASLAQVTIKSDIAKGAQNKLVIHFINVGQGDCTLIELPDGKTMLIDAGQVDQGEVVVEYLNGLEINTIDYMVATHSDSDHIGGLIKVLKEKDVKNIYRPFDLCRTILSNGYVDELYTKFGGKYNEDCMVDSTLYAEFLSLAYEESVNGVLANIYVATNNINIASTSGEPYLIKFFNPRAETVFSTSRIQEGYTVNLTEDQNETSAIIGLFTENHKYLFTADVPSTVETSLMSSLTSLEKDQLSSVTVLKIAHHGSKYSTSSSFLNLTKPKYALIGVGENDYGHPAEEVISRLTNINAEIYRTDEFGTIIIEEVAGELYIRTLGNDKTANYGWIWAVVIGFVVVVIVLLLVFGKKIKFYITKKRIEKIK